MNDSSRIDLNVVRINDPDIARNSTILFPVHQLQQSLVDTDNMHVAVGIPTTTALWSNELKSGTKWSSLFSLLPKNAGDFVPRSFDMVNKDGVLIPPPKVIQAGVDY